ncbi:MAG TPA: S8 family serine peptidase, partial [Bdellovibrionales bacterium]|nr:S8 family serine peptidase [Bdellovibrionales bacterium]
MFNRIIISLVAITAIAGCTGQSKPVSSLDEKTATQNLFSNRPIDVVPDVYVITLNAPPLLEVGTKVNGKWEIPQAAKDLVLNEQTAFEQKLKNVASDAQVIFRYRLTLNALAVYAPANAIPAIAKFAGVRSVAMAQQMARPQEAARVANIGALGAVNPSNFIGSEHAYRAGFTGAGMRVGVLDTGIDYTHKMLGGSGVVADYKAINPDLPAASFPNAKVVGGVDLAGTAFNAASPFSPDRLPKPDANPLDEAGHGTHVAGTIVGIGDGVNGFDGVAKDATVYAVKVFGKNGSTMDAVVIAGFEFAADPNGDLNPDDQLDAINLSLGGGFGQPQILYNQAVRALSGAGTLVVASAGNSGPVDYIVGAPGTADEAISIAASIDGSEHNWRFPTVKFIAPNNPHWVAKAVEGPISKALSEIGPTEGELVDIGLADADLTDGQKAKLAGKVALISRGKVSFAEKLQRAFAGGAVGAVVYNNEPAKPFAMGGDGKVEIPAIMVSQALGLRLIEEMKVGPTRVQFKNTDILEEPELIDTITSFSSKGPRSQDNLIKPEIAAPGQMVISAAMGEGA